MEQDHQNSLDEIIKALTRFQFIEEGIKVYLKMAYSLIEQKTQGQPPIRMSTSHLENKPLGSPLQEFKKYNDNDSLISNVKNLMKDRNYLAHRAFYITYEHLFDQKDLNIHSTGVRNIREQAEKCVEQLIGEIAQIESSCLKAGLFSKKMH